MKVYLFLSYSVYLLMFFPALVVQQIQRRPAPVAGFSYGSLVTGIWSWFFFFFFLLGDKGSSESFVSQLLKMVL